MSQVLINESTLQDVADSARGISKKLSVVPEGTTVIGYKYTSDTSSSSSGTLSTFFRFTDYFSDFQAAYVFIMPEYIRWTRAELGLYTSEDGNSNSTFLGDYMPIVIPYTGKNKTGYHNFTVGSNPQKFLFILLDENFNPIIYDENIHAGLPTYTFTSVLSNYHYYIMQPYMYKKENHDLLYPKDFDEEIRKIRVAQYPYPLCAIDINNKGTRFSPMDARFLGIDKLEDLKMVAYNTSTRSDNTAFGIFQISQENSITVSGFEEYGKGYKLLNLNYPEYTYSNNEQDYPAHRSVQSLHMKDHRLYVIRRTGSADYATFNSYSKDFTSNGRVFFIY